MTDNNAVDQIITVSQAEKQSRILVSELHKAGRAWLTNNAFVYNAVEVPIIRHNIARRDGNAKRWHVHSAGGLGDQICAVGTVDYIHHVLKAEEIVVSSHYPEIYYGRNFVRAIKIKSEEYEQLDWERYFTVETLISAARPHSDWLSLHMINCLDIAPLVALGRTLPKQYRNIKLYFPTDTTLPFVMNTDLIRYFVIHAGKTWPSRTIPPSWWNEVLALLIKQDIVPVLIGAECPNGNGTVELNSNGCFDMRGKLSFHETLLVMSKSDMVLTNDSGPYHMACALGCNVHVLSTGRPFDYIDHGIGAFDHALGNKLDTIDLNNRSNNVNIYSQCTEEEMMSWLPYPKTFIDNILNAEYKMKR